jgi:hypothetical protein
MNQTQARQRAISAFRATVVPLSAILKRRDLNAELYSAMDDEGAFDEPWWLDYSE